MAKKTRFIFATVSFVSINLPFIVQIRHHFALFLAFAVVDVVFVSYLLKPFFESLNQESAWYQPFSDTELRIE